MSAPNDLSFLPDDYFQRKGRRRANALCAGLAVVVMGAIGTAFTLTERSMRALDRRHGAVEKEYTEAAKSIEQVNTMRLQQQRIVHRADLASSLVEKVPRSNLLAEFTNSLPAGTSLLELAMESRPRAAARPKPQTAFEKKKASVEKKKKKGEGDAQAPPPPQAQLYDVTLRLTGVADTDVQVAQFISKLNASKLLRDVNLVISDEFERDAVTMRKFEIEMMIHPDAEVSPAEPERKTAAVELGTFTAVEK